jgi:hypothetical protein
MDTQSNNLAATILSAIDPVEVVMGVAYADGLEGDEVIHDFHAALTAAIEKTRNPLSEKRALQIINKCADATIRATYSREDSRSINGTDGINIAVNLLAYALKHPDAAVRFVDEPEVVAEALTAGWPDDLGASWIADHLCPAAAEAWLAQAVHGWPEDWRNL